VGRVSTTEAGDRMAGKRCYTRGLGCLAVLAASAAIVSGCGANNTGGASASSGSSGSAGYNLGIFVQPSVVYAAQTVDAFKGTGMKPVVEASGGAALPLIASGKLAGQADVAPLPLVLAFAQHVDVKAVWLGSKAPDQLVIRKDIASLKDLSGKKIGAPSGGVSSYILKQSLASQGVKNVTFVDLDPNNIVSAFKTGQIDGAEWAPPQTTEMLKSGGRLVYTKYIPTYTIFSSSFIKDHPDQVQNFVCRLSKMQGDFHGTPQPVWDALSSKLNLPNGEIKNLFPLDQVAPGTPASDPKWTMDNPDFVNLTVAIGNGMKAGGLVPESPSAADVKALFDTRFAQKASDGGCS
jgi:ABC-type nitrate/sulfonate/bicarbonate transport system substrate-binding protein